MNENTIGLEQLHWIGWVTFALLCTSQPLAASAQDDAELEEIVVTGIRGSLHEALALKRRAGNVIDSIVAEDIGKLPDQNVAEALQRVPGVAISRDSGEGRNISVRGMDGSFNVTMVNGRRLATENPGREFSYDVLASEIVSRIDVHKTPQARLYEGGIGAVVDIQTLRPFDLRRPTLTGSFFSVNDELSGESNPRVSLVMGDTFANDSFGALVSINYIKRDLQQDSASINQYRHPFDVDLFKDGTVDYANTVMPRNLQLRVKKEARERLTGSVALQWQASDEVLVSFDGLYSDYKIDNRTSNLGVPLDVGQAGAQGQYWQHPAYVDAVVDADNNLVYARFGDDGTGSLPNPWAFVETVAITEPRKTETYLAGLNVDWAIAENISLNGDLYVTEAQRENNGDNWTLSNRIGVNWAEYDWRNGGRLPDVRFSEPPGTDFINTIAWNNNTGVDVTDSIWEAKFGGEWLPDQPFMETLRFGVSYSDQQKENQYFATQYNNAYFGGNLAGVWYPNSDPRIGSLGDFHRSWIVPDAVYGEPFSNGFLSDVGGDFPRSWPSLDVDRYLTFLQTLSEDAYDLLNASHWPTRSYAIQERASAAYLEADFVGTIGADVEYTLNVGVRYAHTKQTSKGTNPEVDFVSTRWNNVPVWFNYVDNVTGISTSKSYSEVLPSANLKLEFGEKFVGRMAAARVMTRAPINHLRMAQRAYPEPWNGFIERGNPGLAPFLADQFDLSLEWYYSDSGAVVVGAFFKDVDTFVTTGPNGQETNNYDLRCLNPVAFWECQDHDDVPLTLEIRQPFNVEGGGEIQGLEFAWQQSMEDVLPGAWGGLGFQANLTLADSESELFDKNGNKLPFLGMSDLSYNVIAYYEVPKFGARLAYNYRDSYFSEVASSRRPDETYVQAAGKLDFSAYYNINEHFTINAYGRNLTDEAFETTHGDGPNKKLRFLAFTGPQYGIGIRAKF